MSCRTRRLLLVVALWAALAAGANARAAESAPATVGEAAKVIDLAKLPLFQGADQANQRCLSDLSYSVLGKVEEVFKFHAAQLTAQKWKQLPNASVTPQSASAFFAKEGYTLTVMVYEGGEPGKVSASVMNFGNVDLQKLPIPAGAKPFYSGPTNAAYLTTATPEATVEACHKLLTGLKWLPYGDAIGSRYYKKNAIQLSVSVQSAPAQQGKTVLTYSGKLMSLDLPAPADATNLQYRDSGTNLFLDTKLTLEEVAAFYKAGLAPHGWKPTTDAPLKTDFTHQWLFLNAAKDWLTLEVRVTDGSRVTLHYQTAAEIAEIKKRLEAKLAANKAESTTTKAAPDGKVALTIPAGAKELEAEARSIEFKVDAGQSKAIVEGWRKTLVKDGWKELSASLEAMAGTVVLQKGDRTLTLLYIDTGLFPAEITVSAIGVDLEQVKAAKK